MDLTEAEDVKRWQEYTELYKKAPPGPHPWPWARGNSSQPPATAERTYPTPEVRGGGREEQPQIQGAAAVQQEGRVELFHIQRQEGWPWGDNPPPR